MIELHLLSSKEREIFFGRLFSLDELKASIADELGTSDGWALIPDEVDPQALIFEYPNITPRGDYIQSL